jgi:capsular exopolysaccharide synthesis family protein
VEHALAASTLHIEPDGDLNHLLNALFRRRWLILGIVLGSFASAIAILLLATPRYTAETRILLEGNSYRMGTPLQPVIPVMSIDATTLNSQVEVLRSPALAREVVARLRLVEDAEFNEALQRPNALRRLLTTLTGSGRPWPTPDAGVIDRVQRRLNVRAIDGSEVILLQFSSNEAAKAAAVANAFADAYLAQQLAAKRETTARTNLWLNDSITDLREKVAVAEQAVEDFRRQSGLVESGGETLTSQEISGLNAQLVLTRGATAEAEARLEQVRGLAGSRDAVLAASDVLDSPLIQRLREQEAELARRQAEMASEFGPQHPRMTQLRAEAEDLQAKISLEINKVARRLENEVRVARVQEESLSGQLEQLKLRTAENNDEQIQLRALEREAEANRNLLATLLARFKEIGSQSNETLQQPDARIVSAADVPIEPSFPNTEVVLGLVLIGSLLLAGATVLLLELRDRTFHSGDEIERVLGIPSLGLVPLARHVGMAEKEGDLEGLTYRSQAAFREALHTLNWTISLANKGEPPRSVLITSSQPDEGKTTIALALASFQATVGRKVLLIDADTRKAALPSRYGRPDMRGLTDVLQGADVSKVILRDGASGLEILPAGQPNEAALSLLASPAFDALLADLSEKYDLIVLDSPPISAVADACLLSRKVEATVFVVRWAETRREVVEHCVKLLRRAGGTLLGGLLSMVDVRKHAAYLYGDSGKYQGRLAKYYEAPT